MSYVGHNFLDIYEVNWNKKEGGFNATENRR